MGNNRDAMGCVSVDYRDAKVISRQCGSNAIYLLYCVVLERGAF